jgi:hypothetical protein
MDPLYPVNSLAQGIRVNIICMRQRGSSESGGGNAGRVLRSRHLWLLRIGKGGIDGLQSTSSRRSGIEGDDIGVNVNIGGLGIGGSFIFFERRSKLGFFVRKLLKRHFEN